MTPGYNTVRPTCRLALAAMASATILSGFAAAPARAANHALIFWIGEYANPRANLPGIDADGRNAKLIAGHMGVPQANVREVSNQQLTNQKLAGELAALNGRIADNDKVFIYYSGHGFQQAGAGGARCTESIVARGGLEDLYFDYQLQSALGALGRKASQVVMMNDSCFSGGAATKSLRSTGDAEAVPKFYPGEVKVNTSVTDTYQCGEAVNKFATRALEAVPPKTNVLYIAASADNEVSYATRRGSVATLAWAQCLGNPAADINRSGAITGTELKKCAQHFVDANSRNTGTPRQTITLQGDEELALSFAPSQGTAPINAHAAFEDLRRLASRDVIVTLESASRSLRIKQDFLDFTVTSNMAGYLYLLQAGSDGKLLNQLFPNKLDTDNRIEPGKVRLPRQSWRIRAGGPAGTSHVIAVVSPERTEPLKDISGDASPFASAPTEGAVFRNLFIEATGASGGQGRFGASAPISIQETSQ